MQIQNGDLIMAQATLIVHSGYTLCSACGKNADLEELYHLMTIMIGKGCGAEFVAIRTCGMVDREFCSQVRPDLPYAKRAA
jgi:hypothetical protein